MWLRFHRIFNAPHEFNWYFVAAYLRISVCEPPHTCRGIVFMNSSSLLIGIDVGWSEKKASCAFAVCDPYGRISWPDSTTQYGSGTHQVHCRRFKHRDLIAFLETVVEVSRSYERTVVILDGPLGSPDRPQKNRQVDSEFRRGGFYQRMLPMDIESRDGETYVNATYEIAECFEKSVPVWPFQSGSSPIVLAETNPTVGLALMTEKHDVNSLPSRKRPLMPPSSKEEERAILAKSDFYWRIGGSQVCGAILNCPEVQKESDHELVAGIYCLTVACALDENQAMACGADDGVYVFPSRVHSDWENDLNGVGTIAGSICIFDEEVAKPDFSAWTKAKRGKLDDADSQESAVEEAHDELACKGDVARLLLNDNGAVHPKHNDWLYGVSSPVTVRFLSDGTLVTLCQAENNNSNKQWKIDGEDKANALAESQGLVVKHLSNKNSISIEVEIL